MSFISLYNSEHVSLLSDKLFYSAEETGALHSVVEKIETIDRDLATASERIAVSQKNAVDAGYKEGFAEGMARGSEQGNKSATEKILNEHHSAQLTEQEIKKASINLAIDIVRHIGLEMGNAETIRALAENVIEKERPGEAVTVCVSPEQVQWMESLNTTSQTTIVADENLASSACVLRWHDGRTVEADLDTQLDIIRQHLLSQNEDAGL